MGEMDLENYEEYEEGSEGGGEMDADGDFQDDAEACFTQHKGEMMYMVAIRIVTSPNWDTVISLIK